jgi:hypothetical protein
MTDKKGHIVCLFNLQGDQKMCRAELTAIPRVGETIVTKYQRAFVVKQVIYRCFDFQGEGQNGRVDIVVEPTDYPSSVEYDDFKHTRDMDVSFEDF